MGNTLEKYDYLINLKVGDFIRENPYLESHREDLVQESRIRVYKQLKVYDETKSSIETYVRNNTQYACYKYRDRVVRQHIHEEGWENMPIHLDCKYDYDELIESMGFYQRREREIIQLHLNGYTQQHIATKIGTYQQEISRTLRRFREIGLHNHNKYGMIYEEME